MKGKLVYVVDDDTALAEAVAGYLRDKGLEVAIFTSPLEALNAAAMLLPDLLLSDFSMDGMDGLTLATKVMELHPECKVLLMSGVPHDAIRHPAHGDFELLQKPLRMSVLLSKITTVLEEV